MHRTLNRSAALFILLFVTGNAGAGKVVYDPSSLLRIVTGDKNALVPVADDRAVSGTALEAVAPFRLETYGLQRSLQPGWHRLRLRVRVPAAAHGAESLAFAFWSPNKIRSPETFRYDTTFAAEEFPAPGRYGELTRTVYLGPSFGNYGMSLHGFKGLRLESLTLEAIERTASLERLRTNKLLYGLHEAGKVAVSVLNVSGRPQAARLTVTVESGLDDSALLFDRQITVAPAIAGQADIVEIPLPPQSEYGHAIVATLQQGDTTIGTARDYCYTTDRPALVGHLGFMGLDGAYDVGSAPAFVEKMRRHCFPLYEIPFWAPDDVLELLPPAGKDRWWSGQTLARVSTESLKERIRLGHEQGMKVLAYTNLRYDFGFRIADDFRRRPEFCEWDANNGDMAYAVSALKQQARQDDSERFDSSTPNKPKFRAQSVWRLASGNPDVVDAHIEQQVRSTKFFGWDGWRYDDRYDYDQPAVDMLGRQLPKGGWRNPAIVGRIRSALQKAKPGMIYGHNLEWAQDEPAKADVPMPLDTAPHSNDYYTEFLRDGGLHLQERWLAHMIERHAPWTQVRDYLLTLGHNAYRRGGYAYGLSYINNARPSDTHHLVALHLAGLTHLAGDVLDGNIGEMRLACRYADLLYGDHLVPLPENQKVLQVNAGNREVWWQRYVRYREVAPGRRVYFVHLINPPRTQKVGEGETALPEPITDVGLNWNLPPGWKATRAYQLSAGGDVAVEPVYTTGPWARQRNDVPSMGHLRRELAVREEKGVARVTLPALDVWSIVALDCRGPATDVAPDVRFPLPPLPGDATDGKWQDAINSEPNRIKLIYDSSEPKAWTRPDPASRGKRVPMEMVADADTTTGQATRCTSGWQMEAYRPGEAIQEGRYRVSVRLKSTANPPVNARLVLSAWSPPKSKQPWRVSESISLTNLSPDKGWQTFSREVDLGYGHDNFGLQMKEGFDGLLIDQIVVEELQPIPDSERLRRRSLTGWPTGLGLTPHDGLRVWLGDGLYGDYYRFAEALQSIPGVTLDRAEHWTFRERRGFHGPGWAKAEELAPYDLVIFSNVDLRTLSLEQRDWLRGYVEAGGSLLLTGGPYGLGGGGWQDSDLIERLLPVKLHNYDLRPDGVGKPMFLQGVEGGILSGDLADRPATLWLHEAEAKPGSVVHLKAGDRPVLVTGTAGKGRVAVLALTPLGEVPADALVWWQWSGWDKVAAKTAEWLLKKR